MEPNIENEGAAVTAEPNGTRRRGAAPFLLLFLVVGCVGMSTLSVVGCGGGSDGGSSELQDDAVDQLYDDVKDEQKKAERAQAARFAKDDYQDGESWLDKAKYEDDASRKKQFLLRAKSKFEKAYDVAKDAAKDAEVANSAREAYVTTKTAAEEAKELLYGGDMLDNAERNFKKAEDALEDQKFDKAERLYETAKRDLDQAIERSTQFAKLRERALVSKGVAEEAKTAAEGDEASEHAFAEFERALATFRSATNTFTDNRFEQAELQYNNAREDFVYARQVARQAQGKAIEGPLTEARSSSDVASADSVPTERVVAPEIEGVGGDAEPSVGDEGETRLDLKTVLETEFEGSTFNGRLLKMSYLGDGTPLRDHCLVFTGREGATVLWEDTVDGQAGIQGYAVAGGEVGGIVLKPKFNRTGGIKITFRLQNWKAQNPYWLRMLAFADPTAQDGYAVEIGSNGVATFAMRDRAPRGAHRPDGDPNYKKAAGRWFDKKKVHSLQMAFVEKDGERRMKVWLDEVLIDDREAKNNEAGHFGLWWNGAKFFVEQIDVNAAIDVEWAEELARNPGSPAGGGGGDGSDLGDLDF